MRTPILILISFCFLSNVIAQPTAKRTLSITGYLPGGPEYVSISVSNNTESLPIIERPPEGWEINEIVSGDAIVSNGSINFTVVKRQTNLVYIVLPPESASGDAIFSGEIGGVVIGGDTILNQRPHQPIGIFQHHGTYPGHNPPGNATFNSDTGEYYVEAGYRVRDREDGYYCFSPISGSFEIEARIRSGSSTWGSTAMLYVGRPWNLPTVTTPVYYVWRFSNGYIDYGFQSSYGGGITDLDYDVTGRLKDQKLKIVRQGDEFQSFCTSPDTGEWMKINSQIISMVDPVYVGLGSKSIDESVAKNYFTEVKLTRIDESSPVEDWDLYQ